MKNILNGIPPKFDPGKWPVCRQCGQSFPGWMGENGEKKTHSCGGEVTTLRKYFTEVLHKDFRADEWAISEISE